MRDSFSFSTKNHTASSADRRILNPYCTCRLISSWIKLTMSRVHADACEPLMIALSKDIFDHGGTVLADMTSSV